MVSYSVSCEVARWHLVYDALGRQKDVDQRNSSVADSKGRESRTYIPRVTFTLRVADDTRFVRLSRPQVAEAREPRKLGSVEGTL
jgi:hypothetical protein